MRILKRMFKRGEPKEEKILPWIHLTSLDQLNGIHKRSQIKTQVIFKYSTRCGVSRMVLNSFVANFDLNIEEVDLFYLDLLSYPDVSKEVMYRFQVMHQSPQLIVIKNGVAVVHASHGGINAIHLSHYI
jgi:bacillithiol system protein YtxJ